MKTVEERKMQKPIKEKQIKTERSKKNRNSCDRVRTKCFCSAFKLIKKIRDKREAFYLTFGVLGFKVV